MVRTEIQFEDMKLGGNRCHISRQQVLTGSSFQREETEDGVQISRPEPPHWDPRSAHLLKCFSLWQSVVWKAPRTSVTGRTFRLEKEKPSGDMLDCASVTRKNVDVSRGQHKQRQSLREIESFIQVGHQRGQGLNGFKNQRQTSRHQQFTLQVKSILVEK